MKLENFITDKFLELFKTSEKINEILALIQKCNIEKRWEGYKHIKGMQDY